jgi:hypothetical protein
MQLFKLQIKNSSLITLLWCFLNFNMFNFLHTLYFTGTNDYESELVLIHWEKGLCTGYSD